MKFTYTGMHGVGYQFVKKLFSEFEIPEVIPVKEQVSVVCNRCEWVILTFLIMKHCNCDRLLLIQISQL